MHASWLSIHALPKGPRQRRKGREDKSHRKGGSSRVQSSESRASGTFQTTAGTAAFNSELNLPQPLVNIEASLRAFDWLMSRGCAASCNGAPQPAAALSLRPSLNAPRRLDSRRNNNYSLQHSSSSPRLASLDARPSFPLRVGVTLFCATAVRRHPHSTASVSSLDPRPSGPPSNPRCVTASQLFSALLCRPAYKLSLPTKRLILPSMNPAAAHFGANVASRACSAKSFPALTMTWPKTPMLNCDKNLSTFAEQNGAMVQSAVLWIR